MVAMNDARKLVEKLGGRKDVLFAVFGPPRYKNQGESNLSDALKAGTFPANWYGAITELCDLRGVEHPPKSMFNFKDFHAPEEDESAA